LLLAPKVAVRTIPFLPSVSAFPFLLASFVQTVLVRAMLLIPYGDSLEDKSEMAHHPSAKQKMKVIAIVISLACFYRGALADDQATPSPTPVYLYRPARPGTLRHQEEIERRRELEAQAKADRRSAVAAQAEARAAARVREQREQAQRKVEAEERAQAANATPHATSDLMSRMGFSAQEIAAQKAREQSLKPEAKETMDVTSQAGRQSQSRPAVNSGTPEDHLTRSHAEKPTSPSPDSGSH